MQTASYHRLPGDIVLRVPSDAATRAALAGALEAIGDRWSLLVVAVLLDGPRRFGDLEAELAGVASNVLSDRLRRLEQHGLVVAEPYQRRPPRFAYELTEAGRELAGPVRLLAAWGARHGGDADLLRHDACGTALETRWWCPTCEVTVEDDPADDLHYA